MTFVISNVILAANFRDKLPRDGPGATSTAGTGYWGVQNKPKETLQGKL
jgi:hypothetical protein